MYLTSLKLWRRQPTSQDLKLQIPDLILLTLEENSNIKLN